LKQLSGQDSTFLYLDRRGAHLNLTGLYIYRQPRAPQPPVRTRDVVRHVRGRLDAVPLFRQKLLRPALDLDFPYWVDDPDFRIENHIHRYDGVPPADRAELYAAVARIHAAAMDFGRPPWAMYVIENPGPLEGLPRKCFAIITRYHHAAIDGASGMQLIHALHDSRPAAGDQPPTKRWKPAAAPGTISLLARAAFNNVARQVRLARSVAGAAPAMLRSVLPGGDSAGSLPVPETRFNGAIGADRVFHAESVALAEVQSIRGAVPGCTVNDVLLATCGGGLRAWLQAREELPEDSVVAMVPVNLRPSAAADTRGNRVAMMAIPLHSDIADPLARLRAVHEAARRAKAGMGGDGAADMHELIGQIPAPALSTVGSLVSGLGLNRRLVRLFNCTVTNVPSPSGALYLGHGKLVHASGAGPILDGMGLIVSLFTFQGKVDITFTSCPEMLPDPGELGQCTRDAFNRLRVAAQAAAAG
jgi:WS/DGAT/MGAT family acyltransferase